MDEYISRQAVLKYCEAIKENASRQIREWKAHTAEYKKQVPIATVMQRERDMESAIMYFHALPPADVMPVVRCKDCVHFYFPDNRVPEEQEWVCELYGPRNETDYCSHGSKEYKYG